MCGDTMYAPREAAAAYGASGDAGGPPEANADEVNRGDLVLIDRPDGWYAAPPALPAAGVDPGTAPDGMPRGYGWEGGSGTAWRTDPDAGLTGILLTQRMLPRRNRPRWRGTSGPPPMPRSPRR
jgi:CubicO group peptidase (beta-lactamase class C family)